MDRVVYPEDGAVAHTSEPLTLSLLATGFLLGGGATAGAIAANALLAPEHKQRIDEFWKEDHWRKIQRGWDDVAGRFTGSRDAQSQGPAANSAAASSATAGKRQNVISMSLTGTGVTPIVQAVTVPLRISRNW